MNTETRQELFNYMSNEHGLHLLENELDEIERILGDKVEFAKTKCKEQDRNTRHDAAETILFEIAQLNNAVLSKYADVWHNKIMNLKSKTPDFE